MKEQLIHGLSFTNIDYWIYDKQETSTYSECYNIIAKFQLEFMSPRQCCRYYEQLVGGRSRIFYTSNLVAQNGFPACLLNSYIRVGGEASCTNIGAKRHSYTKNHNYRVCPRFAQPNLTEAVRVLACSKRASPSYSEQFLRWGKIS